MFRLRTLGVVIESTHDADHVIYLFHEPARPSPVYSIIPLFRLFLQHSFSHLQDNARCKLLRRNLRPGYLQCHNHLASDR